MVRDTHPTSWTSLLAQMLWGLEGLKALCRNLTGGVKSGKIRNGGCGPRTAGWAVPGRQERPPPRAVGSTGFSRFEQDRLMAVLGSQTRNHAFGDPLRTERVSCGDARPARKRRTVFVARRLPLLGVVAVVFWSCGVNWGQAESAVVINELHVESRMSRRSWWSSSSCTTPGRPRWTFPAGSSRRASSTRSRPGRSCRPASTSSWPRDPTASRPSGTWGGSGIPDRVSSSGRTRAGWSNDGERVVLCDAAGAVVDEVEYQLGFPWPTVGDPVSDDPAGHGALDAIGESGVRQRPGRQLAVRAADAGGGQQGRPGRATSRRRSGR